MNVVLIVRACNAMMRASVLMLDHDEAADGGGGDGEGLSASGAELLICPQPPLPTVGVGYTALLWGWNLMGDRPSISLRYFCGRQSKTVYLILIS